MTYNEEIKIENKAIIYTDGACWQDAGGGVGGWGALIIENGQEHTIYGGDPSTTNNKMEMTACIKALESLSEKSIVTLYTDSKYIVSGITHWTKGWKKNGWITQMGDPVKNKDLWLRIDELCIKHRVNWQWVRGHSGNRGNEIADLLAVRGKEEEKEKIRQSLSKPKFSFKDDFTNQEHFDCRCSQYYKELYEERAGIIQFDGRLSQTEAEEKALAEITNLWLDDEKLSLTNPATYNALTKFKRELKK